MKSVIEEIHECESNLFTQLSKFNQFLHQEYTQIIKKGTIKYLQYNILCSFLTLVLRIWVTIYINKYPFIYC